MKQLIFFILVAFLLVGLYFNFFFTPDTAVKQTSIDSDTETIEDVDEVDEPLEDEEDESESLDDEADPEEELSDEDSEDTDEEEESTDYETVFQNEELNDLYQERVDNGESLNISLQLPAYYNAEALLEKLNDTFDDENINFEYGNLEASSLNLSSIFVEDTADVVMYNAMQVTDFDIQILHNRTLGNIQQVYQDLVNQGLIVYIIGDPDIYDNANLEQTLDDDNDHFTDNDYNYIHLNGTAEGLFDTQLNDATLDNIVDAFYERLTE